MNFSIFHALVATALVAVLVVWSRERNFYCTRNPMQDHVVSVLAKLEQTESLFLENRLESGNQERLFRRVFLLILEICVDEEEIEGFKEDKDFCERSAGMLLAKLGVGRLDDFINRADAVYPGENFEDEIYGYSFGTTPREFKNFIIRSLEYVTR